MKQAHFLIASTISALAVPATAQIASQFPVKPGQTAVQKAAGDRRHPFKSKRNSSQDSSAEVFTPNAVIDVPPVPDRPSSRPPHAIAISADGLSWITSVDGRSSGQNFSAEQPFTIRGHGLSTAYTGRIVGSREVPTPGKKSTRYQSTGSILKIKVVSDTEVLATVSRIRAGEIPWSSTNAYASGGIVLTLKLSNGPQEMSARLASAYFHCRSGDINCD